MASLKKDGKIKFFFFDLEGVLVPKNLDEDSPLLAGCLNSIKIFFEKLNSLGFSTGIVTLRHEDKLIAGLKEIPNCTIINATIDKATPVEKVLTAASAGFENLFYMGDDMFDIPLLNKAAVSAAPSNAHKEAKRNADFVIPYAIIEDLFNYILKEIIEKE